MILKSHISAFLSIAFLGALIYSNTFHAAFHYDDFTSIVSNPAIHVGEFPIERLLHLLTESRPLAQMTFAANYYLGGLDVEGYHIVNTVIHMTTGILLYLFIYETLNLPVLREGFSKNSRWISLLSSLLWLSNPVQTQAVTYIVQRMTSMASMFYVLALLFFVKGRVSQGGKRWVHFSLTVLSFFLSLGSKQISITLPILIAIYEVCFFQRGEVSGLLKKKAAHISIVALVLIISATIYYSDLTADFPLGFPLKERIYTESRVIFYYITLLLFPLPERMSLIYDYPLSHTIFMPITTLFSVIGLIAISVYAMVGRRRRPLYSFFILWFVITISGESVIVSLELVFEHRLYLPSMAFFPLLAIVGFSAWERRMGYIKYLHVAAATVIVLAYSVNTYERNAVWIDGYSIFADSVRKYPHSVDARLNLGFQYLKKGMVDEAIAQLERAKAINPRRSEVRGSLGESYFNKGLYNEAAEELEKAVELGGGKFEVYGSLGDTYTLIGDLERAESAYKNAIESASDPFQRNAAMDALVAVKLIRKEGRHK